MIAYRIEPWGRGIRLLKDDNPNAQRPFDGASIHYAPEQFPARICAFDYGPPVYRPGEQDGDDWQRWKAYAQPVSYPSEMLDYREIIVSNAEEWRAAAEVIACPPYAQG